MASTTGEKSPGSKSSASKSKANGSTRKSSAPKPAKSAPRDGEGRFKSLANRGRNLNVSRNQAASALAVTAVGIGVGLLLNWLRHRDEDEQHSPAAYANGEDLQRDNFNQTRNAGPDAMRDEDGEDWDSVDQALDESFPASDPASTY